MKFVIKKSNEYVEVIKLPSGHLHLTTKIQNAFVFPNEKLANDYLILILSFNHDPYNKKLFSINPYEN